MRPLLKSPGQTICSPMYNISPLGFLLVGVRFIPPQVHVLCLQCHLSSERCYDICEDYTIARATSTLTEQSRLTSYTLRCSQIAFPLCLHLPRLTLEAQHRRFPSARSSMFLACARAWRAPSWNGTRSRTRQARKWRIWGVGMFGKVSNTTKSLLATLQLLTG